MAEKQKKPKDSLREPGIAISIILMVLSLWCIWHTIFWVIPINIIKYMMVGIIANLVAIIVIKRARLFSAIPAYVLIAVLMVRLILALSTEIHMRYYGTLYEAVHTGNAKVVQHRIDEGCDVNEPTNGEPIMCEVFQLYAYSGRYEPTPAKNIRERKIVEMLKVFIDNGANVNAVDKSVRGWSALFWAVVRFQMDAVELLVNNGADVNLADEKGYTPLHLAQTPIIAQILIDKGANVNARDKDGNTPLHTMPVFKAQILIDNGADVNAKNEKGETPLDLAIREGHRQGYDELIELLRKHGAKE